MAYRLPPIRGISFKGMMRWERGRRKTLRMYILNAQLPPYALFGYGTR